MPAHGITIIYTSRRFYIFMGRTEPVELVEPTELAEPLLHTIKGRHAHELTLHMRKH